MRYGDQTVVLSFQDLIQVEQTPTGNVEVSLRNLEYDLTSAIKKVVFGFQSLDSDLAALDQPVQLTFYVTPNTLPDALRTAGDTINTVATDIANESNGKFVYKVVNVDDPNSGVTRQYLQDTLGLQPFPASFFSSDTYYAHMVLQNGQETQVLYPPTDVTEADVRTTIESAIKRTSSGFLKAVGIWTPPNTSDPNNQFGTPQTLTKYNSLQDQLRQDYTVRTVDLTTGQVPSDIDTLLVIGPQNLTDQELFTIDQFLMRGGSVTLAVSNYQVSVDQFSGGLALQQADTSNLLDWLANYGIDVQQSLVMDTQNQPFPVPVVRQVGNAQVQEIQAVNYPFFVDIRPDGMDT
ncbi:MAG: GldG family protein [Anaerolineae bacterium]